MKDSGVEWIGEIPKDWEVKKLGYLCSLRGRIGFKGYTKEDLVSEDQGALVIWGKHIDSEQKFRLKKDH